MADNDEQANLIVSAVNEATQTLNEIQGQFESFEGSAQSLGITSVALGGILKDVLLKAFSELKDMVKLGINEAIDAEQQQVKLTQAFKEEGAAAQESIKSINAMAEELGGLVGVDNDVIVATATTMRQIGGLSSEMINRAMPAIADLATRTGSLESAAMTVTRAMNGQARQLKMLGIDFESTGDKGRDMEVLLGKINEKFGGQAQANMATTGGKLQNLKVVFTDIAQSIGEGVIQSDAFQGGLEVIKNVLSGIKNVLAGIKPPEPTYTNDAEGRDRQRLDLMKQEYAARDELIKLQKELKELQKNDPDLIGDYTALNDNIDKQTTKLHNLVLATAAAADARKKAATEKPPAVVMSDEEKAEKEKAIQAEELKQAGIDSLLKQAYERRTGLKSQEFEADIQFGNLSLENNQEIQDRLLASIEENEVEIDEVKQRHRQQQYLMEQFYAAEVQQLAAGVAQAMTSTLGQSLYNIVAGTNDSLSAMKKLWHDFGNFVLRMIAEMIAKVLLFNALMAIADMGTGGIFGFAKKMAGGLFSGQTAEGSTRLVPGPPNMAVPIMAHGGETIGRAGGSNNSGGLSVIVQGDYYESEEANGRLFDRLYNFQKRTGVSFGV